MSVAEEYISQGISQNKVGAFVYLAPNSSLIDESVEQFKSVISQCIEKRQFKIVVDLSASAQINSCLL